jgi:hypothetical protein
MSFIFVSYSRQDQDYVSLLAQALETHSLPVWLDDHIDYGTTWPRDIKEHLDQCRVFVVVMSPRSENSLWVQNELTLAQKLKKPIFPLLLEGDHWFQILTIQSVDVTRGKLPPARFFNTLRPYFPVPHIHCRVATPPGCSCRLYLYRRTAHHPIGCFTTICRRRAKV